MAEFTYEQVCQVCEAYFKSMDNDFNPTAVISKPEKQRLKLKWLWFYQTMAVYLTDLMF